MTYDPVVLACAMAGLCLVLLVLLAGSQGQKHKDKRLQATILPEGWYTCELVSWKEQGGPRFTRTARYQLKVAEGKYKGRELDALFVSEYLPHFPNATKQAVESRRTIHKSIEQTGLVEAFVAIWTISGETENCLSLYRPIPKPLESTSEGVYA